jgi:adenine deaminase
MNSESIIVGKLVDIPAQRIYRAVVSVSGGLITGIEPLSAETAEPEPFICPGFIDAHVHIESSMLVPSEFARLAVVHGTVATVSDPHEIANVCGMEGVQYMMQNGATVPFHFNFGAPSCVPATVFETAGAALPSTDVAALLANPAIRYLSEMMNFPGVLSKDPEVMAKIEAAHRLGKPVDGHAPGLRGADALGYASAGISTDHECYTIDEAREKLSYGMHILIREGSAARNFDALIDLLKDHPEKVMFCSDDKHPDSLVEGHINVLCARAAKAGIPVFHILRAACLNPILHYALDLGRLRVGDAGDFILLEDLNSFRVLKTFVRGELVAEAGKSLIGSVPAGVINRFVSRTVSADDFRYPLQKWGENEQENFEQVRVIEALDGQLITGKMVVPIRDLQVREGALEANPAKDILKMVVVNRYQEHAPVAKTFVKNFGLKEGALASSVAHDSHNVIAVGTSDELLCEAVRLVMEQRGGISCVTPGSAQVLPLSVGGLMSTADGYVVARAYTALDKMAKAAGSTLSAPFMTLSFMALLVIPHLKLSDKGLFDGDAFRIL